MYSFQLKEQILWLDGHGGGIIVVILPKTHHHTLNVLVLFAIDAVISLSLPHVPLTISQYFETASHCCTVLTYFVLTIVPESEMERTLILNCVFASADIWISDMTVFGTTLTNFQWGKWWKGIIKWCAMHCIVSQLCFELLSSSRLRPITKKFLVDRLYQKLKETLMAYGTGALRIGFCTQCSLNWMQFSNLLTMSSIFVFELMK